MVGEVQRERERGGKRWLVDEKRRRREKVHAELSLLCFL